MSFTFKIVNGQYEKLVGVTVDHKLTFNIHVDNLCKNGKRKLLALDRATPYLSLPKKRMLLNVFSKSQFKYCPLVLMFDSRALSRKINRIHEKCLSIIYNDKHSSFADLVKQDRSFSIHDRNLQVLTKEMFEVSKRTSPLMFSKLFHPKADIKFQFASAHGICYSPLVNSTYSSGTESISFLSSKIIRGF